MITTMSLEEATYQIYAASYITDYTTTIVIDKDDYLETIKEIIELIDSFIDKEKLEIINEYLSKSKIYRFFNKLDTSMINEVSNLLKNHNIISFLFKNKYSSSQLFFKNFKESIKGMKSDLIVYVGNDQEKIDQLLMRSKIGLIHVPE